MKDQDRNHTAMRPLVLGSGLVLAILAALSSLYHGDDAGLTALKVLVSTAFGFGFFAVPLLFGSERILSPGPDFFFRHAVQGALVVIWVLMVLWTPGQSAFALFFAAAFGTAIYVLAQTIIALLARRGAGDDKVNPS